MNDIVRRTLFSQEHEQFREQVRKFVSKEIVPFHSLWEKKGQVPKELWRKAGNLGLLCCTVPEEYGGSGADFLYSSIVLEELGYAHATGPGFGIHSEMAVPYIDKFGSEYQKKTWLPGLVSGELVAALAMSEPSAGSDLRSISTKAISHGDGFLISGQKVFISNGQTADIFILAANTEGRNGGISLFVVESNRKGFSRGRNLEKMGLHAQDTSEIFLEDVFVPKQNLIGEKGQGLRYLMDGLARERLTISITCQAKAEAVFNDTVKYTDERMLFDRRLSQMQNTRFVLSSVKSDLVAGRSLVDSMLASFMCGQLDSGTAAIGKLWITEMLGRTADSCLQLFGGWGYMSEYSISKAYADARVDRIAGGSSEVMKEIIARTIW